MNRSRFNALGVAAGLALGCAMNVFSAENIDQMVADANKSITKAAAAVEDARTAIENGKQLVKMIPADSEIIGEVAEMLKAAKNNWVLAVAALDGAKASASKITSASSVEVANDYKLLATANAGVALSGAKVVQTSLLFVEAAANNKTEALDLIRIAMQNSLAAASDVQLNYDRIKGFIAEKYSK